MLASLLASPAALAITPLQDLLQLDSGARMNTPGTVINNWQWRFAWSDLDLIDTEKVRAMIEHTDRRQAHV